MDERKRKILRALATGPKSLPEILNEFPDESYAALRYALLMLAAEGKVVKAGRLGRKLVRWKLAE